MSRENGKPRQRRNVGNEHGRRTSDGMHAGDGDIEPHDRRTLGGRLQAGFEMMHGYDSTMRPDDYQAEEMDE